MGMDEIAGWAAVASAVAGGVSAIVAVVSAQRSRKNAADATKARKAAERTAEELGALVKQAQPPLLDYEVEPNGSAGERIKLSTRRPDPIVITGIDEGARLDDFLVKQPGDQVEPLPITVRRGSSVTLTIFRRQRMGVFIPLLIDGEDEPFYVEIPRRASGQILR